MNKLSAYLKSTGTTQKEFAQAVGLSQAAVSRLCSGSVGISIEKAFAIERHTDGKVPALEWFPGIQDRAAS